MVFVVKGGRLRLSGLTLSLSPGEPTGSATIEIGLDLWPYWLEIAIDHTELAATSAASLKGPTIPDDERGSHLAAECKAGMIAVAASAFALDSLFGSVRIRRDTVSLDEKWSRASTSRHRRITELLGATFTFSRTERQELGAVAKQIFTLRDRAVHPSADFEAPIRRDALDVAVPWPYVAFSAQNADRSLRFTAGVMKHCWTHVRVGYPEISAWAKSALDELEPLLRRIPTVQT